MPTELDAYLDSLGLETEDRTQLATILGKNETVRNNAITAHRERLAHADYTKKTQEIAKERERLTAEQAEMNRQLTKLNKDLEAGQITAAKYRAKLEAINREWGEAVLDLKDLEAAPAAAADPARSAPAADPNILARLEQAERNYGVSPEIAGMLLDAQNEYAATFGNLQGFSARALLKHARENKLPLLVDPEVGGPSAFDRLYKVSEKRREIEVNQIKADAKREAEEAAQRRIDAALAGNATGDRNPNNWNTGSHLLSGGFKQGVTARIDANAKAAGHEPPAPPSQGRTAAESELGGGGAGFAKRFLERRAKGIGFGQEERAA